MSPLTIALALALITGTALHGIGAALHPVLSGEPEAHLRTIAAMPQWRTLHLAMLAGSGLIATGIWVRLVDDRTFVRAALVAALTLISTGLVLNALNIAYMAGAGSLLAAQNAAGVAIAPAVYDATHPIGLMAARFGNLIIALGALVLGWAEWHDPVPRRPDAALAWIAGAGGVIGATVFSETTPFTMAAVALLSGWQILTAVRALFSSRAARARKPDDAVRDES